MRDIRVSNGIVQEHLFDDPLSIVVGAGHPLAKKRKLTATDLASHPWIAPRATSPLKAHFKALFKDLGV